MIELSHNQSATDLVEDINANLQEMSSQVEVAVTDSAESLVGKLNTAFTNVDGKVVLSKDTDAETFVGNLNANFEAADTGGGSEPDVPSILPNYDNGKFGTEMGKTIEDVSKYADSGSLVFMLSTDQHYGALGWNFDVSAANMKKFTELAEKRQNPINVSAVIGLGDTFHGKKATVAEAETAIKACVPYFSAIGKPLILAIGNHDNNRDGSGVALTRKQICDWFYRDGNGNIIVAADGYNWDINHTDDGDGAYFHEYYKDFPAQKLRVVVMDCNNPIDDNVSSANAHPWVFPNSSVEYVKSMFGEVTRTEGGTSKVIDNTMPNDYKLIVLCHTSFASAQAGGYGRKNFATYMKGIDSSVLVMFCGHSHADAVFANPVLNVVNASSIRENANDNQSTSGYYCPSRNANDETGDVWDAVVIPSAQDVIHMIRFGAGFNRHIHTGDIEVAVGQTVQLSATQNFVGQNAVFVSPSKSRDLDKETYVDAAWGIVNSDYLTVGSDGSVTALQYSSDINRFTVWAESADGKDKEYFNIVIKPASNE